MPPRSTASCASCPRGTHRHHLLHDWTDRAGQLTARACAQPPWCAQCEIPPGVSAAEEFTGHRCSGGCPRSAHGNSAGGRGRTGHPGAAPAVPGALRLLRADHRLRRRGAAPARHLPHRPGPARPGPAGHRRDGDPRGGLAEDPRDRPHRPIGHPGPDRRPQAGRRRLRREALQPHRGGPARQGGAVTQPRPGAGGHDAVLRRRPADDRPRPTPGHLRGSGAEPDRQRVGAAPRPGRQRPGGCTPAWS